MASGSIDEDAGEAPAGPGRTTIFKDIRFWLARRLHDRYDLANKIKSHGGIIVPLEKDADMLIADQARKDAPNGSYSYMFIIDSVDNGFIQVKDKYRIGFDPDIPKPERPAKHFRVAFTAEDDASLATWALEHPMSLAGNDTWKQLEEMNHRHTWQSWRDRYCKRYRGYSPVQLKALVARNENAGKSPDQKTSSAMGQDPRSGPSHLVERKRGRQEETRVSSSAGNNHSVHQSQQHAKASSPTRAPKPGKAPQERGGSEDQSSLPQDDVASDAESVTKEELFYRDLQTFVDDLDMTIELECNIGGRSFMLWDLHEVTASQNLPFDKIDWAKVAEGLGYGRTQFAKVAGSLQQCFEMNLLEFIHGVASFEEENEGQEEVLERQEEPHGEPGEPAPPSTAEQISLIYEVPPSPSPLPIAMTKRKRSLDAQWRSPKRIRLDHNIEIPSTPGMDHSPSGDQFATEDVPSPSLRKSMAQKGISLDRNGKTNTERASSELRRARAEKKVASSPLGNPFMPSDDEEALTMTSPSTVKVPPKASRRTLPASFQPKQSSASPRPASQPDNQEKADRARGPRGDDEDRGIGWWMKHYKSQGYSRKIIREAMFKTSMVPGERAEIVMRSMKEGKGVPSNYEGIWTDKDDEQLKFVDSVLTKRRESSYTASEMPKKKKAQKLLGRLEHKHGPDQVEHRRRYLEAVADVM